MLSLICVLLLCAPIQAYGQETRIVTQEPIVATLNGEPIEFAAPLIMENDRVFVPIRSFAEYIGGTVEWQADTQEVIITTELGERLVFGIENEVMTIDDHEYRMDVAPFLHDGSTYLPIRHAAEFLHMEIKWDNETSTASLTSIPLHELVEGDTIEQLTETYQTTVPLLLERNGVETFADMEWGTMLKVVIPQIMANKIEPEPDAPPEESEPVLVAANEDLILLSKIVQVEAGHDSYDSQLAVANVVLNRVNDELFPDTIRDVIYAPGQFPPAHNGLLDAAEPGDNALKAAKAALAGDNNVEGALYFYNPAVTGGSFWGSLTFIAEFGNHRYMGR